MSESLLLRVSNKTQIIKADSNSALLLVKAPIGSTVNILKNNNILFTLLPNNVYLDSDEENADYYFSIPSKNFGEIIIQALLDDNEIQKNITINNNIQYNITLTYKLYLYKAGNTYNDITGGWVFRAGTYMGYVGNVKYYDDKVAIQAIGNGVALYTTNKINLAKYTKLYIDWEKTGDNPNFGVSNNNTNDSFSSALVKITKTTNPREINVVNIDNLTSDYWIGFGFAYNGTTSVYSIWLE